MLCCFILSSPARLVNYMPYFLWFILWNYIFILPAGIWLILWNYKFILPACNFHNVDFSGHDIVVVDSPVGRLDLTVSYDLRFPELYQLLRFQQDAQVSVLIVNFCIDVFLIVNSCMDVCLCFTIFFFFVFISSMWPFSHFELL